MWINIKKVSYFEMSPLQILREQTRNHNCCIFGSIQWNLLKQRLLFIENTMPSYSNQKPMVFAELLFAKHVKR